MSKLADKIELNMMLRGNQSFHLSDDDLKAIVTALRGVAQPSSMREALQECVDVLALVEHPRCEDPQYGADVAALGDRIGYGALMSSASASWRKRLKEDGDPVGGEFVAGPCQATVTRALRMAREALALPSTEGA